MSAEQVSDSVDEAPPKPMRADARRNREKILAAAREVLRERGADCSMDEIARRAGVGPGTLYRHFPTREAVLDELMRDWAAKVEADCQELVDSDLPPREILVRWFSRFVDNVGLYKGAAAKITNAMDDPSSPIYRKCQVLIAANEKVMARVRDDGALREDVDPREVVRLVSGVSSVVDQTGLGLDGAEPMLRIVLDGVLRPEANHG